MKVKFKSNWFGPTEFKGTGMFKPSGQRFKRGVVYDLSGDILEVLPQSAIIIDDSEEKSVGQYNKDEVKRKLEEAKEQEALIAKQEAGLEDKMAKARAVRIRNIAVKKAKDTNEKHGIE